MSESPAATWMWLEMRQNASAISGKGSSAMQAKLGIGIMTEARIKASYDFLVASKLIDPAKVKPADAYTTEFVKDLKVLP